MPKQVTLDSLALKGLNIFREAGKLRVEVNYSLMAGTETYKTETRDVSLSLSPATTLDLENAWDTILALIKTSESI
ncbi:MAG: hypothetical protein Q7R34_03260 [Dehalococcoidia bacterium]|nr:hypothetical protein [Dehalococcoidia bacterium]